MFDALGFKGIWRRVPVPEVVVDKLQRMRGSLDAYLQSTFGGDGHPALLDPTNVLRSVHATFLSDTVAVAVVPKAAHEMDERLRPAMTDERLAASAIAFAATLAGQVMRSALEAPPAWAYRGAIAYGEFTMADRFLVGEAVDEAAEHMDEAEGAFVWLAPSAKAAFEKSPGGFGGRCTPLTRYVVPRKGRGGSGTDSHDAVETFVASPFPWLSQVDEARAVAEAVMGTFAGPVWRPASADGEGERAREGEGESDGEGETEGVRRKAAHTRAFLEGHLEDLIAERAEPGAVLGAGHV
jgi:hypothetical protein